LHISQLASNFQSLSKDGFYCANRMNPIASEFDMDSFMNYQFPPTNSASCQTTLDTDLCSPTSTDFLSTVCFYDKCELKYLILTLIVDIIDILDS
jgi:hypothetical protein